MKKSLFLFALIAVMALISLSFYTVKADDAVIDEIVVITDSELLPGDTNIDGKVSRLDLLLLAKHLCGWNVEIDMEAADVTGDGNVNSQDLLRMAKYFGGWDVVLEKAETPTPDPTPDPKPDKPEYDSDEEGWSGIYRP